MSIQLKDNNNQLRSVEGIGMKDSKGRYRTAYILKMNVGGVLRTIWELIVSTFYGKDGAAFFGKGGDIPFMGKDE